MAAADRLRRLDSSGGQWSVMREGDRWRLFTHGLSDREARARLSIAGDQALGLKVLDAVSIVA